MTVVSNTTPFIALSSVDLLHLLPALFERVVVASSVQEECMEGGRIGVPDLSKLSWVTVQAVPPGKQLPVLFELDRGERDTLLLAHHYPDALVLMDERLGRNMAQYLGFQVVGTLGVLAKAQSMGLIASFSHAALAMRDQGIYYSEALIQRIADKLGESKLH